MPIGYDKPHSWLREDDDFDRYNKPGSSDWFSLSDDVSFTKPNNRHDALKVESLLSYGGYMDLGQRGGPLGLSRGTLEKPIKAFQARNGLEVDGLLKPGGPTIKKMQQLYGNAFGATPAPSPAMMDAHVEKRDAGEEGFLHDTAPTFGVKPNPRLDAKAHLMDYERWNRDWARGSGNDPKGLAREYEGYIRDLDKDHGHDPGLIFARDLTQQVEKYHGKGSDLAKQLVTLLADRPDLQRQYLGGEVPVAPPIGTFKPGGEDGVKNFIDQDRAANGIAPRYAIPAVSRGAEDVTVERMSARGLPAPEAHNLLQLTQEMQGLPEDEALRQQAAHDAERARQAARDRIYPKPAEWPEGIPPTAEDWALWYDPSRPPAPLPPPERADQERDRKPEARREAPAYWPNGLPPTGEDDSLNKNPQHAPDLSNPRPPRPGDGYPTEPDYRPEPPPPPHVPGFADEMPHPSEGAGPPRPSTRIDAQIADELPVLPHDDHRLDRPIMPAVVDLSKLDDDAFEDAAAKASADRGRLEEAIAKDRDRERHYQEQFARVVEEYTGTFGDDIVKDGLKGAAQQYAKDVIAGKIPLDFSPETIAKRLGRGALMGLGRDAAVFVGQLAWHAAGEIAANGRAEMNAGAREAHNEWEDTIGQERRERGRIRPDN
jgi:hypothetical protein